MLVCQLVSWDWSCLGNHTLTGSQSCLWLHPQGMWHPHSIHLPTHRHIIKNKNNNKSLRESFIAFEAGIRFQFYTGKNTRILIILIPMNLILSVLKPKQITDNNNEPWKHLHPSALNPWMFKFMWPGELRSRWNSAATRLPLRCRWSQMSLLVLRWEPGRSHGAWRSWLEDAASVGGAAGCCEQPLEA